MADAYWRYGNGRHQPAPIQPQVAKRPRAEFEMPNIPDMANYYVREDDRAGHRVVRDTDTINESYDRYLRSAHDSVHQQIALLGGETGISMSSGLLALRHDDPRIMEIAGSDTTSAAKSQHMSVSGQHELPLPPDASSTLFVEGLPANCTRREVAHIFRPFVGYKEVRLVTKESRRPGGDPLVLCFVDFQSPAHAATAKDALQGYEFDEHDRESVHFRIQFARFPGARSGGGTRGKH